VIVFLSPPPARSGAGVFPYFMTSDVHHRRVESQAVRLPTSADIETAADNIPREIVNETVLQVHLRLSETYGAEIVIANEGAQPLRSYKGRGAANAFARRVDLLRDRGAVCASAGNHSQGFSASCNHFQVQGKVFMPKTTPEQKTEATKERGNGYVGIELVGDTFDEADVAARTFERESGVIYIHPFDHPDIVAGQGTLALEILKQMNARRKKIDLLLAPIGGGGLISGLGIYFHDHSPDTKVIGVESELAAAMHASVKAGRRVTLDKKKMSKFADGAAVCTPGEIGFAVVSRLGIPILTVPEGRLCGTMLDLINKDGILAEPAGALAIDALAEVQSEIKGKTVVCILSGSNFDAARYAEVVDRAVRYRRKKRYFTVELPNRPDSLADLLSILKGRGVNISNFHYDEAAPGGIATAFMGLEANNPKILSDSIRALRTSGIEFQEETTNPLLHEMLIPTCI